MILPMNIHMKQSKTFVFLSFCILLLASITGCRNQKVTEISKQGFLFDTFISIQLYNTEDTELLEEAFQICSAYEQKLSRTIPTSEIAQINAAKGTPVVVSSDTYTLIETGIQYGELSQGSFDITIAPLSQLWDFKNNTGMIPDTDALQSASALVDYQTIVLDPATSSVSLTNPQAMIDLGGIAKGFIADQVKEFLLANDITYGIINLGGNVLTIGTKPDGLPYQVGIQKPFSDNGVPFTTLEITDQSIVTSGIYERYIEVADVRYHHILDPQTGMPIENDLLSVTIVSDSSTAGDALSTICMTKGLKNGMQLIESIPNTEALFITSDYEVHKSSGLS